MKIVMCLPENRVALYGRKIYESPRGAREQDFTKDPSEESESASLREASQ